VGLEVIQNTRPQQEVYRFLHYLEFRYRLVLGSLVVQKSCLLASQARWKEAYEALEGFAMLPRYRDVTMIKVCCGLLMFVLYSCKMHDEKANKRSCKEHLDKAKRYLEAAYKQDGADPIVLHFLASVEVQMGQASAAMDLVKSYTTKCPRCPYGHRIMMDLASKHSDRSQHLDSSLALLDVDPISLHGLASILELYTKEHVRLAQVIKKVAIQLEHIPNESFLWGLLWQTFKQLASAPVSPTEEINLLSFWDERRDWWRSHFFQPSLVTNAEPEAMRQLLHRALCAQTIYENEIPFVSAVRSFFQSRPSVDIIQDWEQLLSPPSYIFYKLTTTQNDGSNCDKEVDISMDE